VLKYISSTAGLACCATWANFYMMNLGAIELEWLHTPMLAARS
jgi:hypothetical protein